jgi:hypothetical protein
MRCSSRLKSVVSPEARTTGIEKREQEIDMPGDFTMMESCSNVVQKGSNVVEPCSTGTEYDSMAFESYSTTAKCFWITLKCYSTTAKRFSVTLECGSTTVESCSNVVEKDVNLFMPCSNVVTADFDAILRGFTMLECAHHAIHLATIVPVPRTYLITHASIATTIIPALEAARSLPGSTCTLH